MKNNVIKPKYEGPAPAVWLQVKKGRAHKTQAHTPIQKRNQKGLSEADLDSAFSEPNSVSMSSYSQAIRIEGTALLSGAAYYRWDVPMRVHKSRTPPEQNLQGTQFQIEILHMLHNVCGTPQQSTAGQGGKDLVVAHETTDIDDELSAQY